MKGSAAAILGLLSILLFPLPSLSRTWYVRHDGTGQAPSIQAAIDSASTGDVVVLANGTFTGAGNKVISYEGKAITVRSESGDPRDCIIDCQNVGRAFSFYSGEGPGSVLKGVTIRNGRDYEAGALSFGSGCSPTIFRCILASSRATTKGGAVVCYSGSSPLFKYCQFIGNSASQFGGGIFIGSSNIGWEGTCTARFEYCEFSGNTASNTGGGIFINAGCNPTIANCTFHRNIAYWYGGGIYYRSDTAPIIRNTIIAYSTGEAIYADGLENNAVISCCDLYSPSGNCWIGNIAELENVDGNFSADPQFCGTLASNYVALQSDSPCTPGNHPAGITCGLIGACEVGCGVVATKQTTWGGLKARYR